MLLALLLAAQAGPVRDVIRARERLDGLLGAHAAARAVALELDDAITFDLNPEAAKKRRVDEAKARVRDTAARALEGERAYDAARAGLASLSAETLATEAARAGDWLLKCELYEALAAARAHGALRSAMDVERDPVVLATALWGLLDDGAAWHLDHPAWQVRLGALRALGESKDKVGEIVKRLPAADARWRNEALGTLKRLTGREMPADAWPAWWTSNEAAFREGREIPADAGAGPGRTTFYDVPLLSTRICFVIDRSGSMRERGRFATAKKELRSLLERLPDGARVNFVFFGGTSAAWTKSTRVLDARARKDAAEWIEDRGFESGTDLYRALEKGLGTVGWADSGRLREDGADTLVLLSDGEATVGRLQDDELIARVIARRARYLRAVVHTISLSSGAPSMKLLADLTGGEYRMK